MRSMRAVVVALGVALTLVISGGSAAIADDSRPPVVEYVPDTRFGRAWQAWGLDGALDGRDIASSPAVLNTNNMLHVYSLDKAGRLLESVANGKPGKLWTTYDLSAVTGTNARLVGRPAAVNLPEWITVVYASTAEGQLLEFVRDWRAAPVWKVNNLTQATGSEPVWNPSVLVKDGLPQVYANNASGEVIEAVQVKGKWTANNLTLIAGGIETYYPSAILVNGVPQVYGTTWDGALTQLIPSPDQPGGWESWDLADITDAPAIDRAFALDIAGAPRVFGTSEGRLMETVWQDGKWRLYNLTEMSGGPLVSNVTAVNVNNVPRVYGVGLGNGHLIEATPNMQDGRIWNSYDLTGLGAGSPVSGTPAVGANIHGQSHVFAKSAKRTEPFSRTVTFLSDPAPIRQYIGPKRSESKVVGMGKPGDRFVGLGGKQCRGFIFGTVRTKGRLVNGWVHRSRLRQPEKLNYDNECSKLNPRDAPNPERQMRPRKDLTMIPVQVNLVVGRGGKGNISDELVKDQVRWLNYSFQAGQGGVPTRFGFYLAGIRRYQTDSNKINFGDVEGKYEGDGATLSPAARAIAGATRKGNRRTLNVWVADLTAPNMPRLSGLATHPKFATGSRYDGVWVDRTAWRGVGRKDRKEGDVLVHEAGHWLSLPHVLFGARNFMSDSSDDELRRFAGTQARKMWDAWKKYRA